jgi:hypothetical protein
MDHEPRCHDKTGGAIYIYVAQFILISKRIYTRLPNHNVACFCSVTSNSQKEILYCVKNRNTCTCHVAMSGHLFASNDPAPMNWTVADNAGPLGMFLKLSTRRLLGGHSELNPHPNIHQSAVQPR